MDDRGGILSELLIDDAALEAAANRLRTAADTVPNGAGVTAGSCGSAEVRAAVERFGLWVVVTAQSVDGRLLQRAADADAVVAAFRALDDSLAQGES